MIPAKTKYLLFVQLSIGCLTIVPYISFSQESVAFSNSDQTPKPEIKWIKNWPSTDEKHQSKRLKDVFNSIFFGIKPPVLSNPVSVFALNPKDYWILGQGNGTVFHIRDEVGDITQSVSKSGFDFSSLIGICSGPDLSLLFTDSKSGKVYRLDPGKRKLQIFNDTVVLEQPTGIAYSSARKEIWIVETKAHRIAVLNEFGGLIRRIGSRGEAVGEFNFPTHIWIGKTGLIYITDAINFRIQVLNPEGDVVTSFGKAGDATGFMARPKGIATDSFGNIYVADALFHVVQVFDLKGNFLYKFGNQGHENGEFWIPSGIFVDDQDYIYVADTYNSRVQIFQLIQANEK